VTPPSCCSNSSSRRCLMNAYQARTLSGSHYVETISMAWWAWISAHYLLPCAMGTDGIQPPPARQPHTRCPGHPERSRCS
jgi:hypothetical protein